MQHGTAIGIVIVKILHRLFVLVIFVPINNLIFDDNMNFKGTIIIKKEEDWFVATCLENNIASQGKTIDEATENLKEAIALFYEDEVEEEIMLPYEQVYVTSLAMAL